MTRTSTPISLAALFVAASVAIGFFTSTLAWAQTDTANSNMPTELVWVSPDKAFTPNGDGVEDFMVAEFRTTGQPVNALIEVLDIRGKRQTTLTPTPTESASSILWSATWDGRNENQEVLPTGVYKLVFKTYVDDQKVQQATMTTEIIKDWPAELISPNDGDEISDLVEAIIAPSGNEAITVSDVRVVFDGYEGQIVKPANFINGQWVATAETSAIGSGEHKAGAYVVWKDRFEYLHTTKLETVGYVVNTDAATSIQPVSTSPPKAFSPNGDGQEDELTLTLDYDQPVKSTAIKVLNELGETVRFLSDLDDDANTVRASWDGKVRGGKSAAEGPYRILFELEGNAGGPAQSITIPTEVHIGPPATIEVPIQGQTLDPTEPLVASSNVDVLSISFRPFGADSRDFLVDQPGDDGKWRVNLTSAIGTGQAYIDPVVNWVDGFGKVHTYKPGKITFEIGTTQTEETPATEETTTQTEETTTQTEETTTQTEETTTQTEETTTQIPTNQAPVLQQVDSDGEAIKEDSIDITYSDWAELIRVRASDQDGSIDTIEVVEATGFETSLSMHCQDEQSCEAVIALKPNQPGQNQITLSTTDNAGTTTKLKIDINVRPETIEIGKPVKDESQLDHGGALLIKTDIRELNEASKDNQHGNLNKVELKARLRDFTDNNDSGVEIDCELKSSNKNSILGVANCSFEAINPGTYRLKLYTRNDFYKGTITKKVHVVADDWDSAADRKLANYSYTVDRRNPTPYGIRFQ